MKHSDTMLTVTDSSPTDITGSKISIGIAPGHSGPALFKGDRLNFLHTSNAALTGTPASYSATQGVSLRYDLALLQDGTNLYGTVIGAGVNPRSKALSEGRTAGAAFVNQGADLLITQGIPSAMAAPQHSGLMAFGVGSGGTSRYDTGSHVDVDGFSILTGLGWNASLPYGSLLTGAFFEAGWGNYDSHNSFNNYDSVKGNGDTHYYGGGIMARYGLTQGMLNGLYFEASARAGHVSTDFDSSDLSTVTGESSSYDSGSAYYGAHAGLGYVWQLDQKAKLDISTKYLWTHQNSDNVKVAGDPFHFKDTDSQRWRTGARFSYAVNDNLTPYVGAAYEHEFDGKTNATTYGYSLDAPKLTGGTGIGELGVTFKPAANSGFSMDLAAQGYTGVREGVSGSFQLKWEF